MIPKILHFIWLTPPEGNEFKLHHQIAVKAAHAHNKDYKILFHCDKEPESTFFKEVRPLMEIVHVEIPHSIFGNPIKYTTNKADLVKFNIMLEYGGIYLDLDIITLRSFDPYLDNNVCMGLELSPKMNLRQVFYFLRTFQFDILKYKFRMPTGLCAGFIMGSKGSDFFRDWIEGYRNFDMEKWAYFAVKLPYQISQSGKHQVKILDPYITHFPSCHDDDLKLIFEKKIDIPNKLFLHYWESRSKAKYLSKLSKEYVMNTDSTFTNMVRRYFV